MEIANPIYDVVFKYLMDDNQIAKILLSAIIGENIIELTYQPQERQVDLESPMLTIYRLDFAARVKVDDNTTKVILIEIQKAAYASDILRFRKYLGEQYINANNTVVVKENGINKTKALPIITIYFLGNRLLNTDVPVIKVNRHYIDLATGAEIIQKEEFIESLTHNSFIIQIPSLTKRRRNELEIILSVFDQSNRTEDHHIMNVNEEDFPENYRVIIRRLQRAIAESKVRQTMDLEDEILQELENKEREKMMALEEAVKKDKIIKEKDKALEKKDKALAERDKALAEKDNALEENKKIIEELKKKLKEKL